MHRSRGFRQRPVLRRVIELIRVVERRAREDLPPATGYRLVRAAPVRDGDGEVDEPETLGDPREVRGRPEVRTAQHDRGAALEKHFTLSRAEGGVDSERSEAPP